MTCWSLRQSSCITEGAPGVDLRPALSGLSQGLREPGAVIDIGLSMTHF